MPTHYKFQLFDQGLHPLAQPVSIDQPITFNSGDNYIFNINQYGTIMKVGHLVHPEPNGDFTHTTWVQVSPPRPQW